jgi:hypothetical protein
MAESEKEMRTDELLDSLLAGYSDAEPRPGMETRIVAHLRAQESANPKTLLGWIWATAGIGALAIVLVGIYFLRLPDLPQPPSIRVATAPSFPAVASTHIAIHPARTVSRARQETVAVVTDVRQEVFPTPAPLSPQEQLLLRYLAGTPRHEVVAQSRADEPPQDPGPGAELRQSSGTELHTTQ